MRLVHTPTFPNPLRRRVLALLLPLALATVYPALAVTPDAAPQVRALIVGINDYAAFPSLRRAGADAALLRTTVVDGGLAEPSAMRLMDDAADGTARYPSGANLRREIEAAVADTPAEGVLVVFISGRAVATPTQLWLVPNDGKKDDPATLIDAVWLATALEKARTPRVLLVLDLAHAALSATDPDPLPALKAVFAERRLMVLAAADAGQRSQPGPVRGAGLFETALAEGLAGAADVLTGATTDGAISAAELAAHARAWLAANGDAKHPQHPVLIGRGPSTDALRRLAAPAQAEWAAIASALSAWQTASARPATPATTQALAGAKAAHAALQKGLAAGRLQPALPLAAALTEACSAITDAERTATDAEAARLAAEAARKAAREVDAEGLAPRPFAEATAAAARAEADRATDKLASAAEYYGRATRLYETASLEVASTAFTSAMAALDREVLETQGGPLWETLQQTLADAEGARKAGAPAAAAQSYREALAQLPRLRAEAAPKLMVLAKRFDTPDGAPTALVFLDQYLGLMPDDAAARAMRGRLRSNTGFTPGQTLTDKAGLTFVYIPPGQFKMGSPDKEFGRDADETPHTVTLSKGFFLCATEVTQAQWSAVMGADYRPPQGVHPNDRKAEYLGDAMPKHGLTWDEAQAFCARLTETTGLRHRLPTEAEWEYACRAGSTTSFSTGKSTLGWQEANIYDAASPHPDVPVPVGRHAANAWGLYDMHGNVWEWCADTYAPYPAGAATDPLATAGADRPDGVQRVLRGGSWYDEPDKARSANRWATSSTLATPYIGLRVVLEADDLPR